ncbi:DUF2255 family protein [Mycobacterium simiae]|uniref:DUF2255 family protein n=1 Tax=Mycobacterium simiae TaxID=1784 RepID=UPI00041EB8C9|nr:DUF2255 family protein [Mycobacterium simiae]PLV54682.1 hypothetical protein X011_02155 [Mycobacterium tuberculosis variant microti OV254]BBX41207.1 hypothetical protein MSIM_26580 [Mycobacterium simiae]
MHSLADELTQPTLVVHSDAAVNPGSVRGFLSKVSAPVDRLWLDGVSQFDFYDQPGAVSAAVDAAADRFTRSPGVFGAPTLLDVLASSKVVTTGSTTPSGRVIDTPVGVVVVDDAGYLRSRRGSKGKWYRRATRMPHGFVRHDAIRFPVTFGPVTDADTIRRVDRATYRKYGGVLHSLLLRPLLWWTRIYVLKITPQRRST